jgi:type IV secretory pathway component VirB8
LSRHGRAAIDFTELTSLTKFLSELWFSDRLFRLLRRRRRLISWIACFYLELAGKKILAVVSVI